MRRFVSTVVLLLGFVAGGIAEDAPGIWLDVPFVKQVKDGCGSASISMVMQYWGQRQDRPMRQAAELGEIQRALYSRKAHGIYAGDLQRYLRQHGFRTFMFRGQWAELEHHLEAGRPLIVAVKPDSGGSLHYEVVAGLERVQRLVLINDPAQRKLLKQDWASFERQWNATGNWVLLALPQAGSP